MGGGWISERQADGEKRDNECSGLSASPRWITARGRRTGVGLGVFGGGGKGCRRKCPLLPPTLREKTEVAGRSAASEGGRERQLLSAN